MSKTDIDIKDCVGVDSETCLIRAGLPSPPVVCTAMFRPGRGAKLYPTAEQWRPLLELFGGTEFIVGHNFAYDVCCYLEWGPVELRELIFKAYDEDRVFDTMLAQRLVEIETGDKRGRLALDQLCARYGLYVEKSITGEDDRDVRTNYGYLLGAPLSSYPKAHRDYALGDPIVTWQLFGRMLQKGLFCRKDLAKMSRTDLGLKLTSAFGLSADPERVSRLEAQARERLEEYQGEMIRQKFMRWERSKPQPVRTMLNIKRAVASAYQIPIDEKGLYAGPGDMTEALQAQGLLTDGGKTGRISVSTSKLVLEESGDPILMALADYGEWAAVWNKDLKVFRWSAERDLPFHTRFGFAATTRTTSGGGGNKPGAIPGMNIQNFRKKEGIRECIRFRFGAGVASDYSGLENGTLAQVIAWTLGRKGMADKISLGHDFHSEVGAHIFGWQFDAHDTATCLRIAAEFHELTKNDPDAKMCRSAAKPLNFGLPGYMSRASTVQSYARIGYGVNRPVEFWEQMIALWYATQHDQVAYLREYVDSLKVGEGYGALYNVPIPGTNIIRRGATRTAAANTGFQGLGAQVAGEGLYLVARAQMLGLMPGRLCAFIHDEVISDCRPDQCEDVRIGHEKYLLQATARLMPDVKMAVESTAMTHWSKKAASKFDSAGRIIIDTSH